MPKARSLNQLLATGATGPLIERVAQLRALTALLRRCAGPELAPHVQAADWRESCLVVQADSAAWATRLRYAAPQLLRCLAQASPLSKIVRVECRIAPLEQPAPVRPNPTVISKASAESIAAGAATITDPALRAALKRLARRADKP